MMNIKSIKWNQHSKINQLQTLLLIITMGSFMALIGWIIGDVIGVIYLIVMSIVIVIFAPTITPKLVMRLYGAKRISSSDIPNLYAAVRELSRRSHLNYIPDLYYIPSSMISAFSVGKPTQAGIAITDGFLRTFNLREAVAVLAHEVSHIRSNDMRVMALADMFTRLTSLLSLLGQILFILYLPFIITGFISINWLVVLLFILAPTISTLAQLGISRIREYDADLNAIRLTKDPRGLANALVKIERVQNGWLEHLFMSGRKIPEPSFLRTHPPTAERVQRLLSYEQTPELEPFFDASMSEPVTKNLSIKKIKRKPKWHFSGLWH